MFIIVVVVIIITSNEHTELAVELLRMTLRSEDGASAGRPRWALMSLDTGRQARVSARSRHVCVTLVSERWLASLTRDCSSEPKY